MIYIIIELPSGFIDEYKFKNKIELEDFKKQNPDCKYGNPTKTKILNDS